RGPHLPLRDLARCQTRVRERDGSATSQGAASRAAVRERGAAARRAMSRRDPSGVRHRHGSVTGGPRRMRIHVRAPATSANLGPGFDVAAVAFELWNELEVTEGDGPVDEEHLGVRAFSRVASPEGLSFRFVDRIPRERGLGSSAATVALGLVAGALATGREASADELLAAGLDLEGHPDNLAAALAGGVCLTW